MNKFFILRIRASDWIDWEVSGMLGPMLGVQKGDLWVLLICRRVLGLEPVPSYKPITYAHTELQHSMMGGSGHRKGQD